MERLTKKIGNRIVFPPELVGVTLAPDNETMHRLLFRLAAYEGTGLEPGEVLEGIKVRNGGVYEHPTIFGVPFEEIQDIVEAKRSGRLVVLPCKVGDMVYAIEYDRDACYDCDDYSPYEFGDCNHSPYYLLFPDTRSVKERICPKHILCVNEREMTLSYWETQRDFFGKTVFLTREEAEEALKGEDHETNL